MAQKRRIHIHWKYSCKTRSYKEGRLYNETDTKAGHKKNVYGNSRGVWSEVGVIHGMAKVIQKLLSVGKQVQNKKAEAGGWHKCSATAWYHSVNCTATGRELRYGRAAGHIRR